MNNLKTLIIILTIFAVGLVGVIITLNFIDFEEEKTVYNNVANKPVNIIDNNIIQNQTTNELQNVTQQNTTVEDPTEQEKQYTDLELMQMYLDDFKYQVFNNVENAYNLIDEEYKNKRFGSVEKFKEYIAEKQEQLSNIEIMQYKVEEKYDFMLYKGTDEHGNYYQIKETEFMEYTIMLDNYTMQDYSDASTEEKIEKGAEKFILMINSADYTNAYNLLEETFKTTYFPTEQDFINYIKNNWYKRNIIASKEATEEGTCVVTIKETIAVTSNKMQKEFKVTLGEGMDFKIEFVI